MVDYEKQDIVMTVAIGAALGVLAVLFLRPKQSRRDRLMKEIEPYRKKLRRGVSRAQTALGEGAAAGRSAGEDLYGGARDVLDDFRDQLVDIAAAARDEFAEIIDEQVRDARKVARSGVRRVRG
ncbi:MAG: hypothetical protein ACRELD_06315 [Longimicrobiales bacterium]